MTNLYHIDTSLSIYHFIPFRKYGQIIHEKNISKITKQIDDGIVCSRGFSTMPHGFKNSYGTQVSL